MQRMKVLMVLVAFALVTAACGGSDSDETTTTAGGDSGSQTTAATNNETDSSTTDATDAPVTRGGTLTLAAVADVVTWSATQSQLGNHAPMFQAPYDSLLRITPDYKLEPWLATEWSYNEDNTVLTLSLRDDVSFSDGTAFDAAAAVENLERFKAGSGVGAKFLTSMAEAVAVDATTLEVRLSEPDPGMLYYLGGGPGMMQSPASFGAADEETNPIGTGPYVMDVANSTVGSVYTFNANPNYWAPEWVKFDQIVFRVITDPTAIVNAAKTGEVDATNLLAKDTVAEVEASGYEILSYGLDWAGLTFVDRDGSMGTPLNDVKVRQAISMAFDREAIAASLGAGWADPTNQVFSAASAGYHAELDDLYSYDPAAAKQMLIDAGYGDGFTLEMPSAAGLGETFYAVVTASLAEIGITAVHTDESADFFGAMLTPRYPAFLMFLEQNPNDWQFINFLLSESAIWNPGHFTDETSAALIDKIQVASSDEERNQLVSELGTYVTEQAWFVPWYRPLQTFAYDASKVVAEAQVGNAVPFLFNFSPAG